MRAGLPPLPAPDVGVGDLVTVMTDGAMALVGRDVVPDPEGPGSSPRMVQAANETKAGALARVLADAGHALPLRMTLTGGSGKQRTLTSRPVRKVNMSRRAADSACATMQDEIPFDGRAAPCDQLWVQVKNNSGKHQAVTILYRAKDFRITPP